MACRDCEDLYSFPVGPQGPTGTNGAAGVDGNYITVANEAAGPSCANGGKKITLYNGADDSVLATHWVCNGTDGSDGSDGTSTNKFIYQQYATVDNNSPIDPTTSYRHNTISAPISFCSTLADGCGDGSPNVIDFTVNIWYRQGTSGTWLNVSKSQYSKNHVISIETDGLTLMIKVTLTGYYRIVAIG